MEEKSLKPKIILTFNEDGEYDGKFWFDNPETNTQLSLFDEKSISIQNPNRIEGCIYYFESYGNEGYFGKATFDYNGWQYEPVDFITDKLDQETYLIMCNESYIISDNYHWSDMGYIGIFEIINKKTFEVKFISIKKEPELRDIFILNG